MERQGNVSKYAHRPSRTEQRDRLYRIGLVTLGGITALGILGGSLVRGVSQFGAGKGPGARPEATPLPIPSYTKETAIEKAQAMLDETSFHNISYAGSVLLSNQRGEQALSEMNPLFVDDPIQITPGAGDALIPTVDGKSIARTFPMIALVNDTGPLVIGFVPHAQIPGIGENIASQARLKLSHIAINSKEMSGKSKLAEELILAQQVLTPLSIKKVLDTITGEDFRTTLIKPDRQDLVDAYAIARYRRNYGSWMPPFWQAYFDTYIQVLPEYAQARDAGLFLATDRPTLVVFEQAASNFINQGALKKDGDNYVWTNNQTAYDQAWINFTANEYYLLTGTQLLRK